MKLTLILLLFFNLNLCANAWSQTRVTINLKAADFKKIISTIEKQSVYHFIYSEKKIPILGKLDIDVRNEEVPRLLDNLMANSGFKYNLLANNLIVITKADDETSVTAPPFSGKVTDEKGQPLVGASVRIKGAKTGTSTDATGSFTLEVPDNTVLIISYLGYEDKEVAATGSPLTIALRLATNSLNEAVVIGYGTQKKVNLTGAIATVNADKLEGRPMVNLADGLEGLIPNLNVNLTSGQPGAKATFNIRGLTTLALNTSGTSISASTTGPLILVDGVSRDPNLIDPNDVESVTVLKDAAASAIYGSRAANGVMLITTKTGKKGPVHLSYSGSYTISRPTQLVDQVNSGDYIKMFNEANRTGLASGAYTTTPFSSTDSTMAAAYRADPAHNPTGYQDPSNPKRYRYVGNTDWIHVLYPGWAPQQQHNVSVSGGQDNTTYLASLGYYRQEGLEKTANQVFQRYTPSLKVNTDVTKWLTFNFNLSLTHTDNNQPAATRINQGGATNGGWLESGLPPVMPVRNPDGNFAGQGNYSNPVAINALSGRDIDQQNDFWSTGRIILKPVNHLTLTADYTWNSFAEFDKANLIPFNEYGYNGAFLDIFPWTNPSQVTETRRNNTYKALNAYGTYENTFAKAHYFKFLLGYNQEYYHYFTSTSLAKNLVDPNLPAIGLNNDSKPSVSEVETESALIGTFTRLNYIYKNRYLLEINARYDGTSRFQPGHQYVFSPSASAGWNIAEESFMENTRGVLDVLKLRLSYGQLPDQLTPPGAASSLNQYPTVAVMPAGAVPYLINGQPGVTVSTPRLISPIQSWEKVQTKNIGLDYSFLRDRLNGSFDYFLNNIKDILVGGPLLPTLLGTGSPSGNFAGAKSHGYEFSLNWRDKLFEGKLSYAVTLSLANTSNTEITSYPNNPNNNIKDVYVGSHIGDIWGFQNNGFYATDAEAQAVNNSALAGYKWLAGDIRYRDVNKDGKIDYGTNTVGNPGDQSIIANSTVHNRFGFNLNLGYKGFDFTTFLQGVLKHDFYPNEYVFYAFRDDEYSIPSQFATDYWTPAHTNAFFPRLRFSGGGNEQAQDKYILNASYVRVKQLTLGYTIPAATTKRWKIQRVRFYITGQNLFTFTPLNKNYDPEVIGFNTYPLNKSLSFGIQAGL
ncbi:MAG: TonB-dependent receptor [Bacteroidetes bacterium]|nr:TonB-dependent receptor [Bacteroidota bacterium]